MYNEQLEKLIEMALMDGELTEKEKQILFKKAESFGVDLDEFEMVLEAKVFEMQKLQGQNVASKEVTAPFQPNHKEKGVSSIQLLIKSLDECERNRMRDLREEVEWLKNNHKKPFSKKLLKMTGKIAKSFLPGGELISELEEEFGEKELTLKEKIREAEREAGYEIIEKQEELISDFLVSTDKDDMLEFLSVAVLKVQNKKNKESGLAKAWKDKCKKVIKTAKKTFVNDLDVLSKLEMYEIELTPMIIRLFKKIKK